MCIRDRVATVVSDLEAGQNNADHDEGLECFVDFGTEQHGDLSCRQHCRSSVFKNEKERTTTTTTTTTTQMH